MNPFNKMFLLSIIDGFNTLFKLFIFVTVSMTLTPLINSYFIKYLILISGLVYISQTIWSKI